MKLLSLPRNSLVAIAAVLWGSSFVAIRWGLEEGIDSIVFASLRFVLTTLLFLPFAIMKIKGLKKLITS